MMEMLFITWIVCAGTLALAFGVAWLAISREHMKDKTKFDCERLRSKFLKSVFDGKLDPTLEEVQILNRITDSLEKTPPTIPAWKGGNYWSGLSKVFGSASRLDFSKNGFPKGTKISKEVSSYFSDIGQLILNIFWRHHKIVFFLALLVLAVGLPIGLFRRIAQSLGVKGEPLREEFLVVQTSYRWAKA